MVIVNALITFNLTVLPLYVIGHKPNNGTALFTGLFRYFKYFGIANAFYLCLYSVYEASNIASSFMLLTRSLNIKFIAVVLMLNIIIILCRHFIKPGWKINLSGKNVPVFLFVAVTLFVSLMDVAFRFDAEYGVIPFEQLLFHIKIPVKGAQWSIVKQFVVKPIIDTVVIGIMCYTLLSMSVFIRGREISLAKYFSKHKRGLIPVASLLPLTGAAFLLFSLNVFGHLRALAEKPSSFYEDFYIDPRNVEISFPETRRNLIVIFVESLETGFLPGEAGGAFPENIVPEVVSLMEAHLNYSQTSGLGGAHQVSGTGWTIAGIVSAYTGVPLTLSFLDGNNYAILGDEFLSSAYGIGDILAEAGYKNYFILGSDAAFGGRDKYFATHKDTEIYDYPYFLGNNYIPDDYFVWWGFEDRKLYQFAKEKLLEITATPPPPRCRPVLFYPLDGRHSPGGRLS
jgi:phosphoglycerol transferase